ncbi:MFS transporter [Pseudonocardia sp. S2-4]|uniref:MFS transporter n=1 Tax=Pseudonocardia humida TaxID=2800819 RepID=A0ABT1A2N8_9PSEU|nr:MFS transporter [Pseudonocardia humida]
MHPAWWVAAVTFLALVGAAGFRAVPGVLMEPLHTEFGWSISTISAAVAVKMALYGLTAPFAAALMERFGIRKVVTAALLVVATGSGLTVFMTASWQLILCWGVLVGLGTGSMALALVATVTGRWFEARRGLVSGVLTAGGAAGALVFLPLVAVISEGYGWRPASLGVAGAALAVAPFVLWLLRDKPSDLGVLPYGAVMPEPSAAAAGVVPVAAPKVGPARLALRALGTAGRTRPFWYLAVGMMICGATTMGLIQPHFIPAAHDHGMPQTVAAGLLALVGLFDIVGTIASGWLTDRIDPRYLLLAYYVLRGLSLMALPVLFGPDIELHMVAFIVFYGLDWVATIPPTMALCREIFGGLAPVVFGWVFASHQVGAALMALGAGIVRDELDAYDIAWYIGGGLAVVAGFLSLLVKRAPIAAPAAGPPLATKA